MSYLGENGDVVSINLYAYCGNNPISRVDVGGTAWETIFDIISLGVSIAEVAVNPVDPWAWIGLAGDIIDVAVPFVGGIGEATKALKAVANAADAADEVVDVAKITSNTLDAISDASKGLKSGVNTVYVSFKDGLLEYVGITNDFARRQKEWDGIREIQEFVTGLDRTGARCVEQTVISLFGKKANGGLLSNAINSIGPKGSKFSEYASFVSDLFD